MAEGPHAVSAQHSADPLLEFGHRLLGNGDHLVPASGWCDEFGSAVVPGRVPGDVTVGLQVTNLTPAATALAVDGAPTMETVLAVAARHGIELLGPIPVSEPG